MVFIETPVFTRQVTELLSDETYAAFQSYLALNPQAGKVSKERAGYAKYVGLCPVPVRVAASA